MKKIIYIPLIVLCALFTSCDTEDAGSRYPQTMQGRIAYNVVEARIFQNISFLDMMNILDYYNQAPEEKKESIKNYHLAGYDLKMEEQKCILIKDNIRVVILHNGKSISEPGIIWNLQVMIVNDAEEKVIIDAKNFAVESVGSGKWKIETTNLAFFNSTSSWYYGYSNDESISNSSIIISGKLAYEKQSNLYDYTVVSGTGNIVSDVKYSYDVRVPMFYTTTNYSYNVLTPVSGKLVMMADSDNVEAEINNVNMNVSIDIHFKGITETWAY